MPTLLCPSRLKLLVHRALRLCILFLSWGDVLSSPLETHSCAKKSMWPFSEVMLHRLWAHWLRSPLLATKRCWCSFFRLLPCLHRFMISQLFALPHNITVLRSFIVFAQAEIILIQIFIILCFNESWNSLKVHVSVLCKTEEH